ncbi:MAG: phosphoribosylaminoimidazolesuccinocarboxamide synthase [Clostridia bacterium]|nr:phosphoribosylaminoimidazolesuccinocarboxamide synthase [Clostridia bacterium]
MVEIGKLLTEGKGKRVYATNDPDTAVVYYKDEAMAFHGLKRGRILGKGEVNNAITAHLLQMLGQHGIKTHFIEQIDARQSLVKRCKMIPLSVKVRNRVAGSLSKRIGFATGTKLDTPVVEFELRDEYLDNPLINGTHIQAMHLATNQETRFMVDTAMKVNEILSDYMADIGVELVDIKMEFGRFDGEILLADEISPDTARFWDARTHEPMDIDRFRRDLGNVEQAYQDLLHRMMGDN